MSDTQDDRLRAVLHGAARQVPFRADLADVERRLQTRTARGRLRAGLLGLLVAVIGVGATLTVLGPLTRGGPSKTIGGASFEGPPEGKLLVGVDSRSEVVPIGPSATRAAWDDLVTFEFSGDGAKVLAATLEHEKSGLGYSSRLLVIDLQTGEQLVIAQADPEGSIQGPARWSPDDSMVAYLQAPNRFKNASLLAQDRVAEYTLCVMSLSNMASRCFAELGTVYSFDWSPGGDRLLLGRPGGEPLQVLDLTTGSASVLVPADDSAVLGVFEQAGFGDVTAVQFIEPSWSPSGEYIGTMSMAGGTVPLVFTVGGRLVAGGHPNPEFTDFSWSPTQDILAYATGVLGEPAPGTPAAYLLDPATGEDKLLLSTESQPNPDIRDVAWGPGGRWLALGNQDLIRIIDTSGAEPSQEIDPYPEGSGALIDWEA